MSQAISRHPHRAEWRALLTPEQYAIMREHGTERPGSCALLTEKRPGVFSCAGCGQPLFESTTKFDSGTGWPSFTAPVARLARQDRRRLAGAWPEPKCIARAAARISATCFPTGRRRPACATASTASRPTFKPTE